MASTILHVATPNLREPNRVESATMLVVSTSTPHQHLFLAVGARIMEAVTTEGCDVTATVPACPDWSWSDLMGHLTGVGLPHPFQFPGG